MVIRKLLAIGNSVAFTVPRRFIDHLGWIDGDYVMLSVQDGKIIIQKVRFPQDEAKGDQHRPD